ncbi:hypothetical protein FNF29_04949 [Cafeteria roenbergensis]|uniref:EamA domain-containing protein n=1 Tax=Cafeteria roenbergensis TaxID=33653 RepID=A0A5A8CD15_CAFRO|nr:hypothetical protein FNF29_04949 [Cafeteria roenbergensis]|eukprot:KAA0150835.1 hypothetical protein FNF29_04949 [Cafeteria roenbergensis]
MAEQNERQLLLLGMLLVGLLVMCGILTIAAWALGGDSLGKPPPEAASARQLMQWRAADMLRWIALWFSAAITLTLWNRWLLSELFQAPLVVTGVHFAVQSGISWIILLRSRPSFWALVSPIAVATASDVCLSNLAVSLVPVWLYTVGKSTSLCFTYAAAVALGLQRFRLRAAGLIAVVFVGVALAAVGGEKGPLAASRAPPAALEPAGAYGPPPEPGPTDPAPDADDADGAGESLPDAAAAASTEGSVAGSALAVGAIAAVAAAAANAARWVTTERLLRQVSDAVADGEVGGGLQLGAAPLDRGAGGAGGGAAAEAAADDDDGSASTSTGGIVWAQRSGCAGDGGESAAAGASCADSEGAMAGAVVRSRAGTDAEFGAESSVGVVVASGSTGRGADGGGAHGRGADGGSGDDDCRSDDTSPTPHREPAPLRRDGSDSLGDFASLDDAESLDLESLSGRPNVAIPVSGGALANRDDDAVAERAGLIQRGSSQEGVAASSASPATKRRRRLDPLFVMAWTAPLCAVMTFVVALPVEGFAAAGSPAWDAVPTSVMAVVGTLAGALLAFVMIGAELQVISRASAITMTVAGHVKEALVIGLGAIVLGETVGVAEAAGIALVLLGTTAFGVLERGGGAHGGAGSGSGSGGDSGSAGAASAGAGTAGGGQRSPSLAQSPSAAAAAAAAKAEAMAVAAGARAAAHGHVDGAL